MKKILTIAMLFICFVSEAQQRLSDDDLQNLKDSLAILKPQVAYYDSLIGVNGDMAYDIEQEKLKTHYNEMLELSQANTNIVAKENIAEQAKIDSEKKAINDVGRKENETPLKIQDKVYNLCKSIVTANDMLNEASCHPDDINMILLFQEVANKNATTAQIYLNGLKSKLTKKEFDELQRTINGIEMASQADINGDGKKLLALAMFVHLTDLRMERLSIKLYQLR